MVRTMVFKTVDRGSIPLFRVFCNQLDKVYVKMPQIDKVTFLSIIYWSTVLYIFQYLFLSVSHLYIFINTFKLRQSRVFYTILYRIKVRRIVRSLTSLPWIYDVNARVHYYILF